jgi:Na+-transporting methylmalonyl-CoA/oxaloacetate decarboxylase gamma subunit
MPSSQKFGLPNRHEGEGLATAAQRPKPGRVGKVLTQLTLLLWCLSGAVYAWVGWAEATKEMYLGRHGITVQATVVRLFERGYRRSRRNYVTYSFTVPGSLHGDAVRITDTDTINSFDYEDIENFGPGSKIPVSYDPNNIAIHHQIIGGPPTFIGAFVQSVGVGLVYIILSFGIFVVWLVRSVIFVRRLVFGRTPSPSAADRRSMDDGLVHASTATPPRDLDAELRAARAEFDLTKAKLSN